MDRQNKRSLKKKKNNLFQEKIKNNKSTYIYSGLAIAVIIIVCILVNTLTSSHALDTSSLLSDQTVDNLEFIKAELNNNKLKVVIHNLDKEKEYSLTTIDVTYLDENGNSITTIPGYIGESIEKDGLRKLIVETDVDLSNATNIRYTIHN